MGCSGRLLALIVGFAARAHVWGNYGQLYKVGMDTGVIAWAKSAFADVADAGVGARSILVHN